MAHRPKKHVLAACVLFSLVGFAMPSPGVAAQQSPALVFCFSADNDLY